MGRALIDAVRERHLSLVDPRDRAQGFEILRNQPVKCRRAVEMEVGYGKFHGRIGALHGGMPLDSGRYANSFISSYT